MHQLRHFILGTLAIGTLVPAQAYRLSDRALAPEDRPLTVSIGMESTVEGFEQEALEAEVQLALERLDAAYCGVAIDYVGLRAYASAEEVPVGDLHLEFVDVPGGQALIPLRGFGGREYLYTFNGDDVFRSVPGSWIINTAGGLASEASITEGSCVDQAALTWRVSQVVTFVAGLDVSDEEGAVMWPGWGPCTIVPPATDDIEGMGHRYAWGLSMSCSGGIGEDGQEVVGTVPFNVSCQAETLAESSLTDVVWLFGDGEEGTGNPVTHEYTFDDNFPVTATATISHPDCPSREISVRRERYIRACGVPKPGVRVVRDRGLRYRLENVSDLRTYGCVSQVRWQVVNTKDDSVVYESTAWEPLVELEEGGVYIARITLSGLAGEDTAEVEFDTRDGNVRGFSVTACGTTDAPMFGLAILLLGLIRRRSG